MSEDNRKVTFTMRVTPAELRAIAENLETHKRVRVNWYHTQYEFVNDTKKPELQPDPPAIFNRPECPFHYCDQPAPYEACQAACRHRAYPAAYPE